jgi:hypothetical protein
VLGKQLHPIQYTDRGKSAVVIEAGSDEEERVKIANRPPRFQLA